MGAGTGVTRGSGGADFAAGRSDRHLVGAGNGRGQPPVVREADRAWLVTGYRLAREFLRDPRFSRAELSERVHPRGPALRMSITEMDPPTHTRIRNLVGGAFSARAVERLRPYVERRADQQLAHAVAAGATGDLLADFCAPFTFDIQCEVLGVPAGRRPALRRCSVARIGSPGNDQRATYRAELRLHAEVGDLLTSGEQVPGGLLAELAQAHRQGLLTARELTGLAASLFFDGHALTAAQLVNAVCYLLTTPDALLARCRDPHLLEGIIEETLRLTPSAPRSMTRIATADVVLGDARIRAGDQVTVALPLANRDHTEFPRPDRFDPSRERNRHLSFGYATHHCIGAPLARVELRAGLAALAARAPNLRLAVPEQHLDWYVGPGIRCVTALPVRWHAGRDSRHSIIA